MAWILDERYFTESIVVHPEFKGQEPLEGHIRSKEWRTSSILPNMSKEEACVLLDEINSYYRIS